MAFRFPGSGLPNWQEMDRDIDRTIEAALIVPVETLTASASVSPFSGLVLVDTTSGSVTVSLPPAANCKGQVLHIKKLVAANTMTIDPDGTETIDGAATVASTTQYISYTIISDGAGWLII